MGQDLRIALRGLVKAPSFTLAAVVTLALGIGGTTLMFSIVDSMMLRPRPFGPRSDRLVTLHSTHLTQAQDWDDSGISYADLRDVGDESTALEAVEGFTDRTLSLLGLGLLGPGVTRQAAQAEIDGIAARLDARYAETNRGWGIHLIGLRDFFVDQGTRRALGASLTAVAFVLLVGAINVAGLLLARGIGRQRELTVRSALGAARARLVRLLVVEALLLALAGALAGLLLAAWGLDALLVTMAEPPPYWVHVGIDGRGLVFVFLLAVATALVSGLLPAVRVSRVDLMHGLSEGGRAAGASPGHLRLQGLLVAGQVALSLTVLVGATLLVDSAVRLHAANAGFDLDPLLSLRVYLAGDRYDPNPAKYQALADIETRLGAVPGVVSATFTGAIPADDGGLTVRAVPERGAAAPGEEVGLQMVPATPAFWDTVGLSLREGRPFTADESRAVDSDVVIVNERLAERLWPGESALGRRLGVMDDEGALDWRRVVGVSPNLVYEEFREETAQSRLIALRRVALVAVGLGRRPAGARRGDPRGQLSGSPAREPDRPGRRAQTGVARRPSR